MTKLIELWKTDCSDCEALKPIIMELEKEGYEFEKYNIATEAGKKIIAEYQKDITEHSKKQKYNPEYLYTPTLINPKTRGMLFHADMVPSKEEVKKLAEG